MTDEKYSPVDLRRIQINQCVTIGQCTSVEQMVSVVESILDGERKNHLEAVDRLERALGISPRTAELRRIAQRVMKK